MKLLDLPPEILEMIASKIDTQSGLNAFVQTNRYLYQAFHLYLYSNQIIIDKAHTILQFTAQKRWEKWLVYGQIEEYILAAAVWLRENPNRRFIDISDRRVKNEDAQVKDFWPFMAWASLKGHEKSVEFLLRLKRRRVSMISEIHIDVTDPASRTALSYAAEKGHLNIVRLLLAAGADPNARDLHFGRTPLHWAGSPRLTGRDPVQPFEKLFPGSQYERAFCPVETYFKEDVPGFSPWNKQREKECDFAYDIENPNFSASLQFMPAPWADVETYKKIVALLLYHGANIEALDAEHRTPLSWAAACGFTSFADVLIHKGANLVYPESPGLREPMSWAAENGHTDTVRLLIRSGASVTTSYLNRENCSMTFAAMNGHDETLALLINHFYYREFFGTANIYNLPLTWAAKNGHKSTVQTLLYLCARHYNDTPPNTSALFWASYHGHTDIVRMILDEETCPNTPSRWDNMTPLQAAVMNRHVSTVKLLLETDNCNVNLIDAHGWSAYSWVAKDREMAHVYRWSQSAVVESARVREVCATDTDNYERIQQLIFAHRADKACQAIKELLLEHGVDHDYKRPKSDTIDPPHAILKIHRCRDTVPLRSIPVSLN